MLADPHYLSLLTEGITAIAELITNARESAEYAQALTRWEGFVSDLATELEDSPLQSLRRRFELDESELRIVVVALASHVDLQGSAEDNPLLRLPPVRLLIDQLSPKAGDEDATRRLFLPNNTLLSNRIVHLRDPTPDRTTTVLSHRIELTPPTVRYLLGETELSDHVAAVAHLEHPKVSLLNVILLPEQLEQVRALVLQHDNYRHLIKSWGFESVLPHGKGITLLFAGPSGTGKTLLAQALAREAKRPLLSLSAADLPEREGLDAILRDLFAEAALRDAIVLIDECDALLGKEDRRRATVFGAIESFQGILILATNHPDRLDAALERRILYQLPFELPEPAQRQQIWEVHLPPEVPLEGDIDLAGLANRFDFTGGTIKNAVLYAVNRALADSPDKPRLTMALLEEGCFSQLRYALESLTVRTSTHLRLKDLVLGEEPMKKIREVIAACRNQSVVLNQWGFGRRLVTGKGITVLFDGPPGTGKTYTAEIVAGELDRPLYRINIPEVVSKYIGETEKHIRAIFQQARISHAMLLFDEADSLFSARTTETRSATDRYANMEVNLLLQEIERFPGICILTTNFFGSLDKALVRRIQFRVNFEEPDASQREGIWEVLTPAEAPFAEDVSFAKLSKDWELTGGMIKNTLLRAAYWAADGDGVITQSILEDACRDEYRAAGKLTRGPVAPREDDDLLPPGSPPPPGAPPLPHGGSETKH